MITDLQLGRPMTRERRLEREVRVYNLLDALKIEYWRVDHDAVYTMDMCETVDKVLGATMCKNLFLSNRRQSEFYLLMMGNDKIFRTSELSSQIGVSRLSFADRNNLMVYLDSEPGAVSFLGLMNDTTKKVKLLVDEDLLNSEWIGLHPCVNTSSLKIRTKDIFGKILMSFGINMYSVKLTVKQSISEEQQ